MFLLSFPIPTVFETFVQNMLQHTLQFGDSVLSIEYANLFDGMCPDLSLSIISTNCLLNVHIVNHGIRSGSDCINLYLIPLSF